MKLRLIIIITAIFLGIGLLAYPYISNYLAEHDGAQAIQQFETQLTEQTDADMEAQRALAEEYNASVSGAQLQDPFVIGSGVSQPDNYDEILDYANHMMGYIDIPKISVYLPIYHGTGEEVLAKGIGHMSQTAFPIGGEDNHSVLTGHTALPNAKLFTDLTELAEGDVFYVHILGETLAYEVDQTKVVDPSDTSDICAADGKDYVTLITCTPYAVNTHRLLVRGERVPYTEQQYSEQIESGGLMFAGLDHQAIVYGLVGASALLVMTVIVVLIRRRQAIGNGAHSKPSRSREL